MFEIDDPVPGLVELPMEVGLAAADGDAAAWAPEFVGVETVFLPGKE